MSNLVKKFPFDINGLNGIKTVEEAKEWLRDFGRELDIWYNRLFDQIENGGMETNTWRIKEATAADITAGQASTVGDLLFQRKIAGVWTTAHTIKGS